MTPERELWELIAKWRDKAKNVEADSTLSELITGTTAYILRLCADELEKLLAAAPAPTPAPPTDDLEHYSGPHGKPLKLNSASAEPVVPEREPLSTAVIACIEKLAKRDLSDSNASYRAGYRDACRHVIEESGLLTVLAAAPRAAGGQRRIQDVLALHLSSIESMLSTYERIGDESGAQYERGKLEGVKRAIEVADNLASVVPQVEGEGK